MSRIDWAIAKESLMAFLQTTSLTVERWRKGETFPIGIGLIRLQVFLDLLGYRVKELQELPQVTKQFAQILALELMTPEGAMATLDYKNVNGVYSLILRKGGAQPHRVYRLERFVEENQEALGEYLREAKQKWAFLREDIAGTVISPEIVEFPVTSVPHSAPQPPQVRQIPKPTLQQGVDLDEEELLNVLARILQLANTMLQTFDTSPDANNRSHTLRLMTGKATLKELITRLDEVLE